MCGKIRFSNLTEAAIAGVVSQNVKETAEFMSELTQVEFDLPGDRWALVGSKENLDRRWVKMRFKDSKRIANILFGEGLRRYQHKYDTIDEWFEKKLAPRILEKYGKGDYAVLSEDKSEATLGSGQRVKTVSYFLLIRDKYHRNVRFAYFPSQEGTRWSYLFVSNKGKNHDQEDAFQKIMKGITFRSTPVPGKQSSR